jgi:selenide, water dikinase
LFQEKDYPDLLIGLGSPDDAAVWRLDDQRALVATTDFFTPVVDDPADYGAISAANSISDIYAMGGVPFLALNIAALPPDLPADILAAILRGGAEKAREAGVVIAGGHTVQDKEPKYGLVVLGMVQVDEIISKKGACPGDHLFLTKPLGFGVTTTALKREQAEPQDVAEVVDWMKRLNHTARQAAVNCGVRGGTDVTGFSLLGHAHEMAQASQVAIRLEFERIPFVSCAYKYAKAWTFPGGAADNRLFFSRFIHFSDKVDEMEQMLLFDPQTSGGLLLSVKSERIDEFRGEAGRLNLPCWEIGEVLEGSGIEVI